MFLVRLDDRIKTAVINTLASRGRQADPVLREDAQLVKTRAGGEQIRKVQNTGRREGKRPIKENGVERRLRLYADIFDPGFVDSVPVLQGCFEIAFNHVHGSQEIRGVDILGIEMQHTVKVPLGRRQLPALESHAGQLFRESRVARRLALAC